MSEQIDYTDTIQGLGPKSEIELVTELPDGHTTTYELQKDNAQAFKILRVDGLRVFGPSIVLHSKKQDGEESEHIAVGEVLYSRSTEDLSDKIALGALVDLKVTRMRAAQSKLKKSTLSR